MIVEYWSVRSEIESYSKSWGKNRLRFINDSVIVGVNNLRLKFFRKMKGTKMPEPLQYVVRDVDTKEQLILSLSDYQICTFV